MKRLQPETRKIAWPTAALLVVIYAIYLTRMVYALLAVLSDEWASYGGVVTVGTIVLAIGGLVALVVATTRHNRRNIGV